MSICSCMVCVFIEIRLQHFLCVMMGHVDRNLHQYIDVMMFVRRFPTHDNLRFSRSDFMGGRWGAGYLCRCICVRSMFEIRCCVFVCTGTSLCDLRFGIVEERTYAQTRNVEIYTTVYNSIYIYIYVCMYIHISSGSIGVREACSTSCKRSTTSLMHSFHTSSYI